jgi:hypothetical protein
MKLGSKEFLLGHGTVSRLNLSCIWVARHEARELGHCPEQKGGAVEGECSLAINSAGDHTGASVAQGQIVRQVVATVLEAISEKDRARICAVAEQAANCVRLSR